MDVAGHVGKESDEPVAVLMPFATVPRAPLGSPTVAHTPVPGDLRVRPEARRQAGIVDAGGLGLPGAGLVVGGERGAAGRDLVADMGCAAVPAPK